MCQEFALIREVGTRIDVVFAQLVLFGLFGNRSHRLHRFEGIFTRSGFTAEHQSIGAIVNSVGNVGHLSTCGTWVVDHSVQHLRGHNHRFLSLDALSNDLALNAGNALNGHFNTEVTARNHNTVRRFNDFIDVVYSFLVFNLRDNLDVAVVRIENVLHHFDVGSRTNEWVSNEINVLLNREKNVLVVALRERREVDVFTRHIHTLVRTEDAIVFHFHTHGFSLNGCHLHRDSTIIKEQTVAHFQILSDVGIRETNFIVCGVYTRTTIHRCHLACLVSNGGFSTRGTHFRTFGINQNTYMWWYGTYVADDFLDTFGIGVCSVHTHYIHPCKEEFTEEFFIATQVTDGANDFSFFH